MNYNTTVADISSPEARSIAIGPFGSNLKANMYTDAGVPVVRGQNIQEGPTIDRSDLVYVSPETASRFPGSILEAGDLVFPHRGAIGRVAYIDVGPMLLSSSMMKLRCDSAKVDPKFLLYYFRGPGKEEILARASTVGTPGIGQPLTSLRSIPLSLPTLSQQQAIAAVLGALDDKIAANTSIGSISDELVRSMFARIANRSSKETRIENLVDLRRDSVNPTSIDPTTPYVGLEHFERRRMWLTDFGLAAEASSTKSAFKRGDILFGKLRPYFHKVATSDIDGICSTDVLVLTPRDTSLAGFTLAAVSDDLVVASVSASTEGTRMPRTKWADLGSATVPWPGETAARAFSTTVTVIRAQVIAAHSENVTLANLRDSLLPQLMSGMLRVKDAEAILEGAI